MGGRGASAGTGTKRKKTSKYKQEYYKFPYAAEYSHGYGSDGEAETVKFFEDNTNFDALIQQMNRDEKVAFDDWGAGFFMKGQQYDGFSSMSPYLQDETKVFDKYLDQAEVNKNVEVVRLSTPELIFGKGKISTELSELSSMEGNIILSKGNMSFAAAKDGLTIGRPVGTKAATTPSSSSFTAKSVEYHLKIPAGSKGAGMWIGDHRINTHGPTQREFLTNRDVYLTVGKTRYDKERDLYVTDLYYEGVAKEHDYK